MRLIGWLGNPAAECKAPAMFPKRLPPAPALLIALVASTGLLAAGVNPLLALAIAVLWLGSLWLVLPEPVAAAEPLDAKRVSRDAVSETIEPLEQPLLLLEGGRIVMANAAARSALGQHVTGQDARIALRHPEAVRLLDLPDGASVTIADFTGGRSLWQLTRRRIDNARWAIELTDRSSEADVSRAHTDFVANASHELRTPLAAIIGYAETLAEDTGALELSTRQRFVSIIQREARRMHNLVEDLMTLSHVEAEKRDVPSEPTDLGALAARVVSEVASLNGKNKIELGEVSAGAVIMADPTQFEQLLRNLADNALKYGASDEPVTIDVTQPSPDKVRVTVRDHGQGIAAEHLPHLTRRFYRTDPGRSRASGGTGLGLAIVKHIVERHGGELDITSELGQGTAVSVTLPAVATA